MHNKSHTFSVHFHGSDTYLLMLLHSCSPFLFSLWLCLVLPNLCDLPQLSFFRCPAIRFFLCCRNCILFSLKKSSFSPLFLFWKNIHPFSWFERCKEVWSGGCFLPLLYLCQTTFFPFNQSTPPINHRAISYSLIQFPFLYGK